MVNLYMYLNGKTETIDKKIKILWIIKIVLKLLSFQVKLTVHYLPQAFCGQKIERFKDNNSLKY